MFGFNQWLGQSVASMTGSGIFGRGARAAALKTDRAIRNISRDIWSKVAAEIDSDARQGRYFGCYAVPRSSLFGNGAFSFANGLRKRNFYARWSDTSEAGDKTFADVAIFWGHKSAKLKRGSGFNQYAFDITTLYFAECTAYGLTKSFNQSMDSEVVKLIAKSRTPEAAQYFCEQFIRMVAMYMYKPDAPSVMNFHVKLEKSKTQLASTIVAIVKKYFTSMSSGKLIYHYLDGQAMPLNNNHVEKELDWYEKKYKENPTESDMLFNGLSVLGSALGIGK